jgi:seryl-tRNA synthetase
MKPLLAILILACVGCTTRQTIPLPPPVVKQPPITQPIRIVAEANRATELVAVKLQTQVDTLQTAAKLLSDELSKGEDQSDALQKAVEAKNATEEQATENAQLWHAASAKMAALSSEVAEVKATNASLNAAVADTSAKVDTLTQAGIVKDDEVASLHTNDKIIRDAYTAKSAEASASAKEVAKMAPIYHTWLWIKWGFIGLSATWIITAAFVFFGNLAIPPPFNILFKFIK